MDKFRNGLWSANRSEVQTLMSWIGKEELFHKLSATFRDQLTNAAKKAIRCQAKIGQLIIFPLLLTADNKFLWITLGLAGANSAKRYPFCVIDRDFFVPNNNHGPLSMKVRRFQELIRYWNNV